EWVSAAAADAVRFPLDEFSMKWAEIEIRCGPMSVDAVSALLTAIGCGGTAIQDNERGEMETGRGGDVAEDLSPPHSLSPSPPHSLSPSRVLGYLPVDDRLEGSLSELRQRLAELPSLGLEVEDGLTLRTVQDQDWESAWKQFF